MFAEVVVDAKGNPKNTTFTYHIPGHLTEQIRQGLLVTVPFGQRICKGWIMELSDTSPVATKPLKDIVYPHPVLNPLYIELAQWIARYYHAPLIDCVKTVCLFKKIVRLRSQKNSSYPSSYLHTLPPLTPDQTRATNTLSASFGTATTKLLYGITGSGKTEVYLAAITTLHEQNPLAQVIVLVPEISLTPQMVERFRAVFANNVIVWHSRLSAGERYQTWCHMQEGKPWVVIGSRSAIFAPLTNLCLIIIDEEHEWTYKQQESPRYHARTIASWLAQRCNIPLILGSATPSLETYYRTYPHHILRLRKRATGATLPRVEIVDMRQEMRAGNASVFSSQLEHYLYSAIQKKEQAVLFLNRRGFAPAYLCRACGLTLRCASCDVSLTLHLTDQSSHLTCHHCGARHPVPAQCPTCHSVRMRSFGTGTQKIEQEVTKRFPGVSIHRMDHDTTGRRGAHEHGYSLFKRGEAAILIGTQMIAKGWDIPNVTVVGILAADLSLTFPDFTAAERTFQLLTQVAGRAGRGDKPGVVILQTYNPEHPVIVAAAAHDFESFYTAELRERTAYRYPPFCVLAQLSFSHHHEATARREAGQLADMVEEHIRTNRLTRVITVLGPTPACIPKRKGMYTYQLTIKSADAQSRMILLSVVPPTWTIDVDPVSLI